MIQVGKQIESFDPKELMEMYYEIFRKPFSADAMIMKIAKRHFSQKDFIVPKDAPTYSKFIEELSLKNSDKRIAEEENRIEWPTEKKFLQTIIKHWLLKNHLVVYDQSCGTQNKMRS